MSALAAFVGVERLLSIDLGARYCGLAVRVSPLFGVQRYGLLERQLPRRPECGSSGCDGETWMLKPEGRGANESRFLTQAAALWSVVDSHHIGGIVFGMPYLANGERSLECAMVEATVARLQRSWPRQLPLLLWDESWSTQLALGPGRPSKKHAAWGHAAVACQLLQEVVHAVAASAAVPMPAASCSSAAVAAPAISDRENPDQRR